MSPTTRPGHRYLKVVCKINRFRNPMDLIHRQHWFTHSRNSHNFAVPSLGSFQRQMITPTLNFLLKVWISNIGSSLICNFKASISFQFYSIMEQCGLESFFLETFENFDHTTVKISIRKSIIALIQLQITLIFDKVGIFAKKSCRMYLSYRFLSWYEYRDESA